MATREVGGETPYRLRMANKDLGLAQLPLLRFDLKIVQQGTAAGVRGTGPFACEQKKLKRTVTKRRRKG
jgi:hypothetical protein